MTIMYVGMIIILILMVINTVYLIRRNRIRKNEEVINLFHAVMMIRGYCEKQENCSRCRCYLDEDDHCLLQKDFPANWKHPKV